MKGSRISKIVTIIICLCVIGFMIVVKVTGRDQEREDKGSGSAENGNGMKNTAGEGGDGKASDTLPGQKDESTEEDYLKQAGEQLDGMDMSLYVEDAADTYSEDQFDPEVSGYPAWDNAWALEPLGRGMEQVFAMALSDTLSGLGHEVKSAAIENFEMQEEKASWTATMDVGSIRMNYDIESRSITFSDGDFH